MIIPDLGFVYRLVSKYGEPHRKFHTAEHLGAIFGYLKEFSEDQTTHKVELDLELMAWCILFHDWIYQPGSSDNELLSAEASREFLTEYPRADMVYEIILATKTHDRVSQEDMETTLGFHKALMLDLDLAGLGSKPADYLTTSEQIAQEFIPVCGKEEYVKGRAAWCLGMIRRILMGGMYNFPYFQSREEQALRNLLSQSFSDDVYEEMLNLYNSGSIPSPSLYQFLNLQEG